MGGFADFYKKTINLKLVAEGTMSHGTYTKGAETTKDILCDVQPTNQTRVYAEYGYTINAEYTVFCDVDTDIKAGATVIYNGNEYTIEKLVDWDNYYILFLKAVS